jgi:plasmid stability protein
MPSLQVRELPINIYRQLKQRSEAEYRSLAQEAIAILAKGLNVDLSAKERRAKLLLRIREQSKTKSKLMPVIDVAMLVREDRER